MTNMIKFYSLICLCFLIFYSATYPQTSSNEKQCTLKGKVLDEQGFVFSGIDVRFSGKTGEKIAKPNKEGQYEITLYKDIYDINIITPPDYYSFNRANLYVSCESDLTVINIYPFPRSVSYGDKLPEIKFATYNTSWSYDRNLNLVIAFLSKKKKGSIVTYSEAMLTFNDLTVSAEYLKQNFKEKTITAEGSIWLEKGGKRSYYKKLSLIFTAGEIKIQGEEVPLS